MSPGRLRPLALPAVVLAVYAALAVGSSRWMSLTFDEPCHILSGIAIAREGDYRFGPNHPPLVRLWFTLPAALDRRVVLSTAETAYRDGRQLSEATAFLHANDAARIVHGARLMVILLAVATGFALWWWSRRLFGPVASVAAILLFATETNLMAHGSLATTDAGMTLAFLTTTILLWRVVERLSVPALLGLAISFSLAQVTKFSALALWPGVAAVLLWKVGDPRPWITGWRSRPEIVGRRRKAAAAAATMALIALASCLAVWGAYGFRRAMAPDPGLGVDYSQDTEFRISEEAMGERLRGIRVLPEAYVRGAAQLLTWPAKRFYFLGRVREEPVWYFFPVILMVKTSSAVLLLGAAAAWLVVRRRLPLPGSWPAIVLPPAIFFTIAIASGMNTGLRHVLPVLPFLILAAGAAGARAWRHGRTGRIALLALLLLAGVELSRNYPDTVASFNSLSGGPGRGDRWAVDTDMDWGQGIIALLDWARAAGIRELNFACHTPLRKNTLGLEIRRLPMFEGQRRIDDPSLPGYVAISTSVLRGYTGGQSYAAFYAPFLTMNPVARIGSSIRVYYVEKPWWTGER